MNCRHMLGQISFQLRDIITLLARERAGNAVYCYLWHDDFRVTNTI